MIKKLSEREHIRQRPNMYIGAVDATKSMEYITEGDMIVYKEVQVVPGLIKIINEIIDNSVDVAIKTDFKSSNIIQVNIDSKKFSIEDNGTGIPIRKNEDGHYLPELCWNHARAGSNFEDDKNRTQIGMNGVGSYATACFSKQFVGATDDGTQHYTIKISNGAESFVESLNKSKGSTGTLVSVYPDLEMFGLTEIDETHQLIIKQRLINLSMSFPEITFKFNKRKINVNTFKKYVNMFNPVSEIFESDKIKFAILPNESDDFRQFSYVNGLKIPDGGIHIDQLSYNIVNGLRDKLVKKFKTIKPGDIRNKLMIVAFVQGMPNTKFSSQSKEKLTNSIKEFNEFVGDIPYDKMVAKILRTPEIIDNITELYRAKEEMARRKELAKMEKTKKKPKSEKFMPPVGPWTNCFLAEGDSASNSISKILGRKGNGFFAMFGVPPNAYDMALKDIIASKKMVELQEILGLRFSQSEQTEINFQNIVITTDFDLPGHFIAGQLLGLFYRFGKNLFAEGRIKRFITPLILVTKNDKIVTWFYDFEAYQDYERKNKSKKYDYNYRKGLGSWDVEELEHVMTHDGFENMLEVYSLDDISPESIDSWLNGKRADKRKEMLDGFTFNIMNS